MKVLHGIQKILSIWFMFKVWSSVHLDKMIKDPKSGYGAKNGLIGGIVKQPQGEKLSQACKEAEKLNTCSFHSYLESGGLGLTIALTL